MVSSSKYTPQSVEGRFFERFHSFQPEIALFVGSAFGLVDPLVEMRFSHDILENITKVTLVVPLPPPPTACKADLIGEGSLSFYDVSAFLVMYRAQDPATDFCGERNLNFIDVQVFLALLSAGCPNAQHG